MKLRFWLWVIPFAAVLSGLASCDSRAAASMPYDVDRQPDAVIVMARGEIDVAGGVMQVVSAAQGRLSGLAVSEGQRVHAGDILARLDSDSASLALSAAQASLEGARAEEQLMSSRRRFAARQFERVQQASLERATSQQALDEAREAMESSEAELSHSRSAREAAETAVRTAELALHIRVIRAPVAGRIVALSEAARSLGFIQEGTLMFTLLPDAPLIVRARIEEDFAPRIFTGMLAEVLTDSNPQQRYSARVLRVGGILRRQDSDGVPGERQDVRTMDCVLSLDAAHVLVGQRVLIRFLKMDRTAALGALR